MFAFENQTCMRLDIRPGIIDSAHQTHPAHSHAQRRALNLLGLILFRREKGQNCAARCGCSKGEVKGSNHSGRPRMAWATRLSRKRAPNSTLALLADATLGSVKLMPAAATVIKAKRIIQPRIFRSSASARGYGHALSHPHISTCTTTASLPSNKIGRA